MLDPPADAPVIRATQSQSAHRPADQAGTNHQPPSRPATIRPPARIARPEPPATPPPSATPSQYASGPAASSSVDRPSGRSTSPSSSQSPRTPSTTLGFHCPAPASTSNTQPTALCSASSFLRSPNPLPLLLTLRRHSRNPQCPLRRPSLFPCETPSFAPPPLAPLRLPAHHGVPCRKCLSVPFTCTHSFWAHCLDLSRNSHDATRYFHIRLCRHSHHHVGRYGLPHLAHRQP